MFKNTRKKKVISFNKLMLTSVLLLNCFRSFSQENVIVSYPGIGWITAIDHDDEGNIYVAGRNSSTHYVLVKLNNNLEVVFNSELFGGGTAERVFNIFYDTQDHSVYLMGHSRLAEPFTSSTKGFIHKFNANTGVEVWQKIFHPKPFIAGNYHKIIRGNGDHLIALGDFSDDGSSSKTGKTFTEIMMLEFDSNGNIFKQRGFSTDFADGARNLGINKDSSFVLGGIQLPVNENQTQFLTNEQRNTILKLDNDFNIKWGRHYDFGLTTVDFTSTTIKILPDGTIISSGQLIGTGTGNDVFIMRTESDGTPIWVKKITTEGNFSDWLRDGVYMTSDSTFLMIGGTNKDGLSANILIEMDIDGNMLSNESFRFGSKSGINNVFILNNELYMAGSATGFTTTLTEGIVVKVPFDNLKFGLDTSDFCNVETERNILINQEYTDNLSVTNLLYETRDFNISYDATIPSESYSVLSNPACLKYINRSTNTLCSEGESAVLSTKLTGNISWELIDGSILSTTQTLLVTPLKTTTYLLRKDGIEIERTVIRKVNANACFPIEIDPVGIIQCLGSEVTLSAQTTAPDEILWIVNTQESDLDTIGTGATITYQLNNTELDVLAINSKGAIDIIRLETIDCDELTIVGERNYCPGEKVELEVVGKGSDNVEWFTERGSLGSDKKIVVDPLFFGINQVWVKSTLGGRAVFDLDAKNTNLCGAFYIEGANEFCFGDTIELEAIGSETTVWIDITSGDDRFITTNSIMNDVPREKKNIYKVIGDNDETRAITIYDSDNCGYLTITLEGESVSSVELCPNDSLELLVKGDTAITWYNTTTNEIVHKDSLWVVNGDHVGNEYKVVGEKGRETFITIASKDSEECFEIYEYITPNSDGYNDYFEISNLGDFKEKISVQVFNKWSQLVYESTDYNNKWSGKNLPSGSYNYVIEISGQVIKGTLFIQK